MNKKKIPYGLSDFKELKCKNFYYVDKTRYIPLIEEVSNFLFFIRPRRFGKSLFLSMLHYYYDEKYKQDFEKIFADTWILKNKTSEAHTYKILRFNFSVVDSSRYKEGFYHHVKTRVKDFLDVYNIDIELTSDSPLEILDELFFKVRKRGLKIFCLIDEYDNFANELLSKEREEYQELVKGQESLYKQFFKILKSATDMENSPLKKMFITGVTPMTLFDVTSGFNIGDFISTNPKLNSMVGFTREEVEEIFSYYGVKADFELLEKWYGNYRFSTKTKERVYNSDMILYYLKCWINTGSEPEELADINIRTDYGKLKWLVYTGKNLNGNFGVLEKLVNGEIITTDRIKDAFSAFELIDKDNFNSLLYYLGLVTIHDVKLDIELKICNETIKSIVAEYISKIIQTEELFDLDLSEFKTKLKQFALHGNLDAFKYIAERLKQSTGIRDYIKGEQTVKMLHLVYLNLCSYYRVLSEPELNKKFADIVLLPKNEYVEYVGLIELKYIPRKESKNIKKLIENLKKQAELQLKESAADEMITYWTKEKNKKIGKVILIYYGWELVYMDVQ